MIYVKDLSKTYNLGHGNEYKALKNISMTINNGEFVSIIGKSGAGKSTLLHVLSGLDSFEEGIVKIDKHDLRDMSDAELSHMRSELIGIILQDYALLDDFTVYENVMLPLSFSKVAYTFRKQYVTEALSKVGILELSKKRVSELSGGQKQRVAISRGIVNHPQYLFADEPTGSLDSKTSNDIMRLFHKLNQEGITIIFITHNMELAMSGDRLIKLEDGILAKEEYI